MHLVYLDESGNSGLNLNDLSQPIFVLCGLIVPESEWLKVESQLERSVLQFFGSTGFEQVEIHMQQLRSGKGVFSQYSIEHRLSLVKEWFQIAKNAGLKVVYRSINKRKYQLWLKQTFGTGLILNPHVVAFPLVALVVNEYLKNQTGTPLGILISDENKEVVHDIEKSLKTLRAFEGGLRLTQIIEKGFFIDSKKCLLLQLCDIFAFAARKKEEQIIGLSPRIIDVEAIRLIEPLIHRGDERFQDVIAWLTANQEKK